jgi:hypothetical protein
LDFLEGAEITKVVKSGMGFRDLELFNLALLGKQGWCLMTDPNLLCARVLKGRYFPNNDFLQAIVPATSSATWRAIVAGREALQLGLIKRIDNGSSVSAWTDNWIAGTKTMRASAQIGDDDINTISDLIDHDIGRWKVELVCENFIATEADAILNIPLRRGGGEDFWAWSLKKTGNYSVKFAYHALVDRNEHLALDEGTITETSTNEKQMWNSLWKLNVMLKVRIFWWRVLHGILPVESTLKHRHIAQLSRCKICMSTDEDLCML